ncbi:MAG: gluconate 2-dehydrogenase subunit 3 family protein [Gemmatimonadota bacterium]|nr:MAG: gluconate 2-dehydrogenase subunit 3 family protein [Gemmatimonadota bacterium]
MRHTFRAVVCTVVPDARELEPQAWAELEAVVARTLRDRPRPLQRRLRLFLRTIESLPRLRYGRPFSALGAQERERFLAGLQEHRSRLIRVGFWGLRTLAYLGYYGRPAAARSIGYRPDPRGWEAIR